MKIKLIVLAITAGIFSANASAALTRTGTTAFASTANSGNSSLMLSIWNSTGSYSYDLGLTLNQLVGQDTITDITDEVIDKSPTNTLGVSHTALITTPQTYTLTDVAAATGVPGFTLSGATYWNLVAGDSDFPRARALISVDSNQSLTNFANGSVSSYANSVNGYFGSLATGAGPNSNPVTAGAGDEFYAGGATWGGSAVSLSNVAWGSSANLYLTAQQSVNDELQNSTLASVYNLYNASISTVNGVTSLTISSVAAVPEADTSAMMIAGLGLMGFIARRRKNINT